MPAVVNILPSPLVDLFSDTYGSFSAFIPYVIPISLFIIFLDLWLTYVRMKYRASIEYTLLEIKLPQEINKSPLAMEIALHAFHQTRDGTWLKQWTEGIVRTWFSLELVSIEGTVHFFIRTPRFFAEYVSSHIYSQFPEVEISETDDYTEAVSYGKPNSNWDLFGLEFKLDKADPYPIKTYIDYGLDKEVRDEKKQVDPITPLIEFLGTLGPNEQIWVQIPIQAAKKRFKVGFFKKQDWKDEGKDLVRKLMKRDIKPAPGQDFADFSKQILSPGERDLVEAIERGISKTGFDCGLRAIYLAKEGSLRDMVKPALVGMVKQFNSQDRNGFKPIQKFLTDFDYPWQDFKKIRLSKRKRLIFNAYKARSFFYPPHKRKPFTLSVEELATIYHFPGAVLETPTFERIPAKTSQPPTNIPR